MGEESRFIARRGFAEDDVRWFSPEAVTILKNVQTDIPWLMDRGYKQSSVIELVGGHYQLSARQRNALQRATSSTLECKIRKEKLLSMDKLHDYCIYIDGFNLIMIWIKYAYGN
ncbi:DUF434 domain-containing protein [Clostridium thermarum]|uniref:DUF434 domain-containing protein n=1 Tax=Clostridium thermarum TaxID=1716543 RepID=UPI00111CC17F|nr:DUF434 domain-containing protein [Clostridium thermarum]